MVILFVRCLHIFISEHNLVSRMTLILAKERKEKKEEEEKRGTSSTVMIKENYCH